MGWDVLDGNKNGNGMEGQFNHPSGLALCPNGDIIVADCWNSCIKRISKDGITTILGNILF